MPFCTVTISEILFGLLLISSRNFISSAEPKFHGCPVILFFKYSKSITLSETGRYMLYSLYFIFSFLSLSIMQIHVYVSASGKIFDAPKSYIAEMYSFFIRKSLNFCCEVFLMNVFGDMNPSLPFSPSILIPIS